MDLYRKMIPPLVDAGYRVLAPDLIGLGRSDKPAAIEDYSYQNHVDWMTVWLKGMNLSGITLFAQDWGSLIGLRLVAEQGDRFDRVVIGNGGMPTGDENIPGIFKVWQAFARYSPWFPVSGIISAGCVSKLSKAVKAAYDAPYPSSKYKAGVRAFPGLVPVTPDNPASEANRKAWQALEQWDKPFLCSFSDKDPILGNGWRILQKRIPGTKGQDHVTIRDAGHFLQEDKGEEIATVIDQFIRITAQGAE